MFKTTTFAVAAVFATAISAQASVVEFVPPNDTDGQVFTTNTNDGWSSGRGIGFSVSADTSITSVGLFHDLTNIVLNYSISEIDSGTGSFNRGTLLRSGGAQQSTSGLEWIDYSFTELDLLAGTNYLIEFQFQGAGNQNFFYDNDDVAWDQDGFLALDGTLGNSFGNTVVAAFRVNGESVAPVPLPAALPLLLGSLMVMGGVARRRKAS